MHLHSQSQWPRGLRRGSTAARLLRLSVRIPPGAWMSVCVEYSVLSGRGLCEGLITRPKKSYRLWCVVVCDLETSRMRRPCPALGRSATEKKSTYIKFHIKTLKIAPICFDPKIILRELCRSLLKSFEKHSQNNSFILTGWCDSMLCCVRVRFWECAWLWCASCVT